MEVDQVKIALENLAQEQVRDYENLTKEAKLDFLSRLDHRLECTIQQVF